MSVRRALPPTAALLGLADVLRGLPGLSGGRARLPALEAEFKEYFGVRHVFLVSSGKAALTLILLGLKSLFPERRRVAIPAYTCFSVPAAVVKAGLEISLCDIDPGTLGFCRAALEGAVGSDTLCVVPTHLFGAPSDLDWVAALARERGFLVVEDAAQALGVRKNGRFLGTIGDVGFFSFGRGKNVSGAGGVVLTNDDAIARSIAPHYAALRTAGAARDAKDFVQLLLLAIFIHPLLYWIPSGLPFLKLGQTLYPEDFPLAPLSAFHAGVLRGWRGRLDRDSEDRKANSAHFIRSLPGNHGWEPGIPYLRLPLLVESREVRDALQTAHRDAGVGGMYPTPINEIVQIRHRVGPGAYPAAKAVSERLVTLPTHHLLTERDRERIVQAVEPHASCRESRARVLTPC